VALSLGLVGLTATVGLVEVVTGGTEFLTWWKSKLVLITVSAEADNSQPRTISSFLSRSGMLAYSYKIVSHVLTILPHASTVSVSIVHLPSFLLHNFATVQPRHRYFEV
jgi:hypothetical protein